MPIKTMQCISPRIAAGAAQVDNFGAWAFKSLKCPCIISAVLDLRRFAKTALIVVVQYMECRGVGCVEELILNKTIITPLNDSLNLLRRGC